VKVSPIFIRTTPIERSYFSSKSFSGGYSTVLFVTFSM